MLLTRLRVVPKNGPGSVKSTVAPATGISNAPVELYIDPYARVPPGPVGPVGPGVPIPVGPVGPVDPVGPISGKGKAHGKDICGSCLKWRRNFAS